MEKVDPDVSSVILDARNLTIDKVLLLGKQKQELDEYDYGSPTGYGEKLEIQLPSFPEQEFRIKIAIGSCGDIRGRFLFAHLLGPRR